jgi:predicted RNase H-like HicB family nuclease
LLAIPFVAVVYSVERDDGEWYRRAEYPELPGCAVEAPSAREAMDRLEDMRIEVLTAAALAGEEIDTAREPLQAGVSGLSDQPVAALLRSVAKS